MKQSFRLVINISGMDLYWTNWQICAWNLHFRKRNILVAEKFIRSRWEIWKVYSLL